MGYSEPPNINKIDFSIWHPLDHHPWEPRCREFYGGWRHHIKIDWELRRGPQVEAWFGRTFCCWWGHHAESQWWRKNDRDVWMTGTECLWCDKVLSKGQPQ